MSKEHLADGAVALSFGGWFLSHIAQINQVLQFVLLVVSIIAGVIAARYHLKKTP